ncbi:MAG: hypothetical protein [Circular genetic element sp.]|nr:MAG: hypothetical protein [Circular genetic element sp.]
MDDDRRFWINNCSMHLIGTTIWTIHNNSLLSSTICFFLVDSNKFLGRFYTVSITVSNQFSVFLECLTIFVSHQKHTPETCARRRSLTPRR